MRIVCTTILLLALAASPSMALTTVECLDCHDDKAFGEKVFGTSVHGDMDCTDCHADLANVKDEHDKVLRVDCSSCHDDVAGTMAGSVHGDKVARVALDLPSCADCHGSHDILPPSDSRSKVYALHVPGTCGACHGSSVIAARHPDMDPMVVADYEAGMHGIVLLKSGMVFSAVCNDCHGSHDIRRADDVESTVNLANINRTCGACHAGVVEIYETSVHGKLFAEGKEGAPVCTSCHSAHRTERSLDGAFLLTVTGRCSGCHEEEAYTFSKNYHGQVTGMGYIEAAQCPDCHGAHNILPKADPASQISDDNLVATCAKCHEGAGPNFVQYIIHADYHDPVRFPLLYVIYLAMVFLLFGVFIFFGIHTLLWFVRAYREVQGKRP